MERFKFQFCILKGDIKKCVITYTVIVSNDKNLKSFEIIFVNLFITVKSHKVKKANSYLKVTELGFDPLNQDADPL